MCFFFCDCKISEIYQLFTRSLSGWARILFQTEGKVSFAIATFEAASIARNCNNKIKLLKVELIIIKDDDS